MKIKRHWKLLSVVLTIAMLIIVTGPSANADAATVKPSIVAETLWVGTKYQYSVMYKNVPDEAKLVSIKSSKPTILKVSKTGKTVYDTKLKPIKAGKAKVTVKYKIGNKTYTVAKTYTVKKKPSVIKSITLNGKKIKTNESTLITNVAKYKGNKTKINLKLNANWKVAETFAYMQNPNKIDSYKEFKVKNNKSFILKSGYNGAVFFTLKNTKTKETIQYGVRLYRGKVDIRL